MLSDIKPPSPPPQPEYEPETNLPELAHDWDMEGDMWDADIHGGYTCKRCGELSDCAWCNKDWAEGNCAKEAAENRNIEKRSRYMQALREYNAQMSYYKAEVEPHVAG